MPNLSLHPLLQQMLRLPGRIYSFNIPKTQVFMASDTSPVRPNTKLAGKQYVIVFVNDDAIKCKHFPRYWPFVHKGQWRGALVFSLICTLNKRLSKQPWGWWFERPSRSLWRHCNAFPHTYGNRYYVSQLPWGLENGFGNSPFYRRKSGLRILIWWYSVFVSGYSGSVQLELLYYCSFIWLVSASWITLNTPNPSL